MELVLDSNLIHNGEHFARGTIIRAEELGLEPHQVNALIAGQSARPYAPTRQVQDDEELAVLRSAVKSQQEQIEAQARELHMLRAQVRVAKPMANPDDRYRARVEREAAEKVQAEILLARAEAAQDAKHAERFQDAAEKTQCTATTNSGERCRHDAQEGGLCGIHVRKANA